MVGDYWSMLYLANANELVSVGAYLVFGKISAAIPCLLPDDNMFLCFFIMGK